MGRPKKQITNNQPFMTETPSATPPPVPETATYTSGTQTLNTQAIAFVAIDESLHIIPVDNITKVSAINKESPTTTVNGLLVKNKIGDVIAALGWEVKIVKDS